VAFITFDAVRIAVNTRLLLKGKLEGLGRFSYEILKRITTSHPEHRFYFLFDRPYSPEFVFNENVIAKVIAPPSRHPVLWHVWFEMSLPRVLNEIKPDLFLSPDGFLSLTADVKSLPVIHDLNFLHNPNDLARSHAWFYNRYFPKYAKKAARIATVSEFSKNDIETQYKIPAELIDVVYNGVSERFRPIPANEKKLTREKWTNGKPYIIYVGAIHQRKNIERMLLAYERFRNEVGKEYRFVIVGNRKWWTESMKSTLDGMKFKSDVIFAGRVPDDDLQKLLGSAALNLYVSTFEGFGIPIIESFQAEIPVITSNVTSMPEIASDAALLVNPTSIEEIAGALIQLETSQNLQERLIEKGRIRSRQFTWERSAGLLWESVLKTVS
jgi:glycosyltransferase involved in cell wall biosynthesis